MTTATAATPMGVSKEHITKTPGVCGGKACIAGTRIRVMDIVVCIEVNKYHPEHIIAEVYPDITVADVFAALAYYHDHRDEMEALFEADRRVDEFGQTQPSRLKEALAKDATLRDRLRE